MQNEKCPVCQNFITYHADEYGKTPFHIRCDNCNIDIGTCTGYEKAVKLLKDFACENLYLEHYNGKIQFLILNKKNIIDRGGANNAE